VTRLSRAVFGLLVLHATTGSALADGVIRVGSKSFTESYILAEIAAQIVEQAGEARAVRQVGLGGTGVAYRALETGAIDLYPEYTGTLGRVILKDPSLATVDALRPPLAARVSRGLRVLQHLPVGANQPGGHRGSPDVHPDGDAGHAQRFPKWMSRIPSRSIRARASGSVRPAISVSRCWPYRL